MVGVGAAGFRARIHLNSPRRDGLCAWVRSARYVFVVAVCAAAAMGCSEPSPDGLLERGEALVLAGSFHEAIAPLKQCLVLDPCNPGAHYYLGQAYLNARFRTAIPPWRLTVALGELDFALACFERMGRPQVLSRFTPDEFEVSCRVKKAQAHLRRLEFGLSEGVGIRAMNGILRALEDENDAARAVMPGSQDVAELDAIIARLKETAITPWVPQVAPAPGTIFAP